MRRTPPTNYSKGSHLCLAFQPVFGKSTSLVGNQSTLHLGTQQEQWKATLAHRFVELLHAKTDKLVRLYTQNIDGLEHQCHQLPDDKVIRVHGTMNKVKCVRCHSSTDFDAFCDKVRHQIKDISGQDASAPSVSTPIACETCPYNAVKPAVVAFGESLPDEFANNLDEDTENVDLLIVMGTSLKVAPANSIVGLVPDTAMRLVVNREAVGQELGLDFYYQQRDFLATGGIENVLLELMRHMGWLEDLESLLLPSSENGLLPKSSAALLEKELGR